MSKRIGAILTCAAFLAVLTILVASRSRLLDAWIVGACWVAFGVGSVVALLLRPPGSEAPLTQLSALPRKWQRWVLGERGEDQTHRPA